MRIRYWLAIVIVLGGSVGAVAQAAPTLSLPDALGKAEGQNLDLAAARERRGIALAGVRVAGQRPNPVLGFGVMRDAPHESVTLDQPLELGPKRGRRIEVARGEAALTELEIAALGRQIRHKARDAFRQAEFARGVSRQKEELLGLARRLRDIAQARFDAGDVAQLEVIQADLEAGRADAELQLAREEEDVAMSRLNAVINEPSGTRWEFASPLETLPAGSARSELKERALQANPEVQHARQELAIEQSRLNLLRAERIPDFSVGVGTDLNNPPSYDAGLRGQFSVSLPLFSRNQGEIKQSIAMGTRLERQVAATRRMIESEVESAAREFGARSAQAGIFHERLVPAAERLEQMAEESYKAGKANILTVLDAERNASSVKREYLDSLLAAHAAFATLEEAVGAPLD
jgi:cobalt-zinc-cadmium efflux system outer membrane protein